MIKKGVFVHVCRFCGYSFNSNIEESKIESCPACHKGWWSNDNNDFCNVCKKVFWKLTIHHIDGNHSNNSPDNRIALCFDCHSMVHNRPVNSYKTQMGKPRRSRLRRYDSHPEQLNVLDKLRAVWLENRHKAVTQ